MSSPVAPITTDRPLRADARRNREAILAAARALVSEHGIEVQMADVAAQAGVGVGTVYRHFPTKEALLEELMRQFMLEGARQARECAELDDPWEAFAAMIRAKCESMTGDAAKQRLWAELPSSALTGPAFEEMRDAALEVVARAREAGVLRSDFGDEDLPGLMCGLSAVVSTTRDWPRLVEFALDGLRARP